MRRSKFGELPGNTAMPLPDDPVRMLTDPFRHFDLAIRHALLRRDALALEIQGYVPAAGWFVDHADCDDELDHGDPQGLV